MANDIKEKVKTLYCELSCMREVVRNVINTLESCDDHPYYLEMLENQICELTQIKLLSDEASDCITRVGQVCNGKITIPVALDFFKEKQMQLDEALECFNVELECSNIDS